ncbi:cilia- and flagella-associated protein 61-like [Mercenaria mercenaria]|uniref:cilia- and flagella-associated protein 61-like n=1 Tax=Mercenaria mercenaria TaxID=6596 RepID=UPI00234F0E3A|nr:cilia- and flagella-associated protein 61-like [Mercenaria mercenaria]
MATTIAPEGVPPEVVNARRTESIDAPHILSLVEESTNSLFGRVNVVNIIEKAVLAVTLCNDKDEILGHAAFFDYPNVADVDQADWQTWLNTYYDTTKSTPLNSLFLHYFVAKKEYAHGCAREIVRTAFNAVPDAHFLYLAVPVGSYPESFLADIFKPLTTKADKSPSSCAMFCCNRHEHVPVVHVRQARVEDHDDLTPIFNRQSDMLKMTYGDYFLAELIEAQDDNMQCLVAEVGGTAYGFMSISNDVNYDLLNKCFELGPFHGLRKPSDNDETEPPKTPTPSPPPQEMKRSPSGSSSKSGSSGKGENTETDMSKMADSVKESVAESTQKSEEKQESGNSKQSSGRSSRLNSDASDVKVKAKLSDAQMVGSQTSLLSQEGDQAQQDLASGKSSPAFDEIIGSPKPPTTPAGSHKRFVPTYMGEPNAFSIQLFCIDERYEMRSADFLAKAFEQFPDRDFCIITVPHLVPEFPLLQNFVRVTPRCPSTLSQELYAFHRCGLLKDFAVRPALKTDYDGVEKLTKTIDLHQNLLKDLAQYNKAKRDDEGTEIQAFVATSQSQVVGVAIIRIEEDIEYIRSHYNIEDFIYYNHHKRSEHARVHHFAINPMFSHLSKHFLKEVLRIGHKTCLYYPLFPPYTDKQVVENYSLISCLREMVPVRHRRQIVYPVENLGVNAPSDRVLAQREPYALNHINRKLTLEPKVTINARIVVVGASDVGIGFLEALAYCPHLQFNNLTLISPHGLPGDMSKDEQRDLMSSTSHCYSHDEYAKIALQASVNVVYGKMTFIDRKKKLVRVSGNTFVPYDHLVLCTGEQYQVPMPTGASVQSGVTNANLPSNPERRFIGDKPKNLFTVNDAYDAAIALYWIENSLVKSQKKVIVYGQTLDAYTCVQTLLSMGLSGDKIFLVQPPPQYETTCVNDQVIEEAMLKAMQECGVHLHVGYILAQWNDGEDCSEIKSASFTSNDEPLTLDCAAFFSYYRKGVDFEAFKAINDACLVYDGKLVIDAYFHTNDVSIRGAGSLTKFQRKYQAEKWSHACFNSKEVGIHLATEMLRLFDPTLEQQGSPQEEQLNLIPIYRNPKIQGAFLPGNFHYLHVKKPGLDKPLVEQMGQSDYGKELVTGSPGGETEYFKLHINQYNNVETITCLAKQPLPCSNLICLYGLHERCLNNMVSRFNEGLIKDFYKYFTETWALAVYHDRFADFREELRELLITRPNEGSESLEERVRNLVDPEMPLSDGQRDELQQLYKSTGAKRAVEARLLNFLSYNYYHLPMYAKPGMV